MKKVVVIILALMFSLGTAACGAGSNNPLMEADLAASDVSDDSGNLVGHCAYLEIDKAEFEKVTEKQFHEFVDNVISEKDFNWYKWVSIICDDGTGICFTNSDVEKAVYGKIGNYGAIIETIGTVTLKDGKYVYEESAN